LEDEEVVLAGGFSEVVAANLLKAGVFDSGAEDGFVKAVVGTAAVAVDDAEAGAGSERGAEMGEEALRVGDLVVDLEHEGGIEGVGREVGVVGCAENGLDVGEVLALGALADGGNGFGVDVFGDDFAPAMGAAGDTFGGADGEPAAACAEVGHDGAGLEIEEIHDAVDLEFVGAIFALEYAEIAGVGSACGVLHSRSRGLRGRWRSCLGG
jgi:hypothetical protein